MPHSYTEKYKTLSDLQLASILNNRDDYKPEAIEAAEHELQQRQIPEETLTSMHEKLREKEDKPVKESAFSSLYERLHQLIVKIYFGHGLHPTERMINAISIWLIITGLAAALKMFSPTDRLFYAIQSGDAIDLFILIAPPLLSCIIAYFFRRKKKAAWIILSITIYIYLAGEIISWWLFLNVDGELMSLMYKKKLYDLLPVILNTVVLYQMNKRKMRALFRITFNWQVMSLCLAIFIVIVVTRYLF